MAPLCSVQLRLGLPCAAESLKTQQKNPAILFLPQSKGDLDGPPKPDTTNLLFFYMFFFSVSPLSLLFYMLRWMWLLRMCGRLPCYGDRSTLLPLCGSDMFYGSHGARHISFFSFLHLSLPRSLSRSLLWPIFCRSSWGGGAQEAEVAGG